MATTYSDVTAALKCIIEHGNVFYVDDDGYVKTRSTNKIQQINAGSCTKDLVVFQEIVKDPNAMILNPFAEGVGKTEDQDWLFASTSTAFVYKVVDTCKFIAEVALTQSSKEPEVELPMSLVSLVSPYLKMVDKNTISDITKITANFVNFMSVFYKPKLKTAVFRCAVFEGPAFRDKFKAAKKTWTFLEAVLTRLFDLDPNTPDNKKLDHLVYKTSVLGYPRFDSKFNLYYKLYELTNPVFTIVEESPEEFGRNNIEYAIDVSELGHHIANFDEYFRLAKNMIQPNVMQCAPNLPGTIPAMPVSTMPMPNGSIVRNNPVPQIGGRPMGSTMPMPINNIPTFNGGMPQPFGGQHQGAVVVINNAAPRFGGYQQQPYPQALYPSAQNEYMNGPALVNSNRVNPILSSSPRLFG